MSSTEFTERLGRVFMAVEGRPTPYGSRRWFAELAHVDQQTVTRWCTGMHPVSGPAAALLRRLESDALTPPRS